MKKCFKCLMMKPYEDFSKHSKMLDGYLGKCKACACSDSKKHREANPEYYKTLEVNRKNNQERKAKQLIKNDKYRKDFPERRSCNQKVIRAIKSGKITPEPCFSCGEEAVAHHADYSRPLSVTWLCHNHHNKLHREFDNYRGPC